MARKFVKADSEFLTLDLTRKVFVGGTSDYAPLSFFCRCTYQADASPAEKGAMSFANYTGNEHACWMLNAAGNGYLQYWDRHLSGDFLNGPSVDVRGDGKWHTWLGCYRVDSGGNGRLRGFIDGLDASVGTAIAVATLDNFYAFGFGLAIYRSSSNTNFSNCYVAEFAAWRAEMTIVEAEQLHFQQKSALFIKPDRLISYVPFEADVDYDVVSGVQLAVGGGTPEKVAGAPLVYPDGFNPRARQVLNPATLLHGGYHRKRLRQSAVPVAPPGGTVIPVLMGSYRRRRIA